MYTYTYTYNIHLSNLKPRHTFGVSGQGGTRRNGWTGRGRAAQDADGTAFPGENCFTSLPHDGAINFWACLWNREQRKSNVNRWRMKTGGSPTIYQQDENRIAILEAGECTDAYLSLQTLFMQGIFGNIHHMVPGHALHGKGLQRQERVRSTGQQLGGKSASRPADNPLTNRSSIVRFALPSV